MKRRLFNLLAGLSLLLFVGTLLAWARSRFATDWLVFQPRVDWVKRQYVVGWNRDALIAGSESPDGRPGWRLLRAPARYPFQFPEARVHFLGLQLVKLVERYTYMGYDLAQWVIVMPMWMVAIATAITPGIWLRNRRRRRLIDHRRGNSLCVQCGYDLRATPERCPECGTAAQRKTGDDIATQPANRAGLY